MEKFWYVGQEDLLQNHRHLYIYISTDSCIKILKTASLAFRNPRSFNDPLEFGFQLLDFSYEPEGELKRIVNEIALRTIKQLFVNRDFPTEQDRLFRDDLPDWTSHAVLDWSRGKFSPYADGYRDGAKALIEQCVQDRGVNDILIYPIVFLYRQYIELRLKEIIVALRYCHGEPRTFTPTHKLDVLWKEMKADYEISGESAVNEDFDNAGRLIDEFCQVDPFATGFRYPVDRDGNQSLTLTHINIRNFGEVMDRLGFFLDAISDQVAAFEDIANEMYNEYLGNIDW